MGMLEDSTEAESVVPGGSQEAADAVDVSLGIINKGLMMLSEHFSQLILLQYYRLQQYWHLSDCHMSLTQSYTQTH